MRELVYYVSVSLDGRIAGPDDQFDAFLVEGDHLDRINDRWADAIPTDVAAAVGITQHGTRFDTVLMGANTYAVGLPQMPSPYRHLQQYVFSTRSYPDQENLTVTAEDPVELVRRLKSQPGLDIWLCGGGQLAAQLVDEIDRLVLKRQPMLFGAGVDLFGDLGHRARHFDRVASTDYRSGVSISEYVPRTVAA